MFREIYKVGIKKDGKTKYYNVEGMETLLVLIRNNSENAERVTIVKDKLFRLDEDDVMSY